MKDKQGLFGKICKTVKSQRKKFKRSPTSNQTSCFTGSPYQKEDSLYDDYDGDNAAGDWYFQLQVLVWYNGGEEGGGWSFP